jgi:hypothetical protein
VEVSPRELRVVTRRLLGERSVAIPCEELEELQIVAAAKAPGALTTRGQVVVARSDRATAVFGEWLSPEELAWVRAIVWSVVSA